MYRTGAGVGSGFRQYGYLKKDSLVLSLIHAFLHYLNHSKNEKAWIPIEQKITF
jgi:hypothetical protein